MSEIHPAENVYVTGEIGINHNGDIQNARKLIDVAAVAGADAVKFQKRNPEKCVPPDQRDIRRQTPWGEMTYIEYRHRIEFGKEEYDAIDVYCKERGIDWYASPWDMDSLEFLVPYKTKHWKVASAMLTHHEMLDAMAQTGAHTFVGTGMSSLEEVDKAVEIFKARGAAYTLMHTVSTYPAKNEELNLNCISFLRERYKCPVGYSGHEFGLLPTVLAVVLGAVAVERHITLNRTMIGSDHLASVEPVGLMKLVAQIKTARTVMGDGVKRVYDSELPVRAKLRSHK